MMQMPPTLLYIGVMLQDKLHTNNIDVIGYILLNNVVNVM